MALESRGNPYQQPDMMMMMILLFASFSKQRYLIVFYWSLSDWKSSLISRTLLSIQTDLINAVDRVVSADAPISDSSSPFTKPLGTFTSAPITRSKYLCHFTFFLFCIFLLLSIYGPPGELSSLSIRFLYFFLNYHKVLPFNQD